MPIYEYRCSACGHELEALQKFSDAPLVACPSCHDGRARQAGVRRRLPAEGQRLVRDRLQGRRASRAAKPRRRREAPPAMPTADGETEAKSDGERRPSRSRGEDRSQVRGEAKTETKSDTPSGRQRAGGRSLTPTSHDAAPPRMKRYLIAGLLVWVPLGITIWVLDFLVTTLDQTLLLVPESCARTALLGFHIPGLRRAAVAS